MLLPALNPSPPRQAPPDICGAQPGGDGRGLPALGVRVLARRAVVPAAIAAAGGAVVRAAGKPTQAFADALERAAHADARWVAAAAVFELLSFAGYVALLWLGAGRAAPRGGGPQRTGGTPRGAPGAPPPAA